MRRWLGTVVTGGVLAGLIALALAKIDLHEVGRAFAHVNGGWIAVGTLLMVGAFLARAESWFAAIRSAMPERPVSRTMVTRVLLIGMASQAVTPARIGEAARAWLIARRTGGAKQTLATVVGTLVSQSLLNFLALALLGVVALAGGAIPGANAGAFVLVGVLVAGVVFLLVVGPKLIAFAGSRSDGPLGRAAGWLRRQLSDVNRGLSVFRNPRTAAHSASFQLGAWALQCGTCYAVLRAFGLDEKAGVATAAAVLLAVNITAAVPVTPSNVGVFQAACIAVLAPLKIGAGTALAYGLVLQAIEIASALMLGLPALLQEGLSPAELRRHTHDLDPVPEAVVELSHTSAPS